MSYFPDCRTDENYNQKYLGALDKEFVAGYDYAVEQIVNMIENNAEVYPELEAILAENVAVVHGEKAKVCSESIQHWAEMERNMLITSMIDNMGEQEYSVIRAKVNVNENV